MLETTPYKKNKINLEDYDFRTDIKNRLLMADFSDDDLAVMEELLFSSVKVSITKLAASLDMSTDKLLKHLEKLSATGLFSIDADTITVNKDARKYFETQIRKFDEDFVPGMEFLQSILKKVPIHVLPNWYPIPRTSNNIFDSLVEKYLQTPQIFQRYLSELTFGDELIAKVIHEVFTAPHYRVPSATIREKFHLSQEQFEELLLQLEFNFVLCLVYERQGHDWHEVVTPFHEWQQYLNFMKDSEPKPVESQSQVVPLYGSEHSFTEDMSALVTHALKSPLPLRLHDEKWILDPASLSKISLSSTDSSYVAKLLHKILFLKLAQVENSFLKPLESSEQWLQLPLDSRALAAYKHTLRHYPYSEFPSEICSERSLREIEKSIQRIVGKGWVSQQEFSKSLIAQISETSKITLKKSGRNWEYSIPKYSPDEKKLIEKVIFEWMFEGGFIQAGVFEGAACIRVTRFGETLFAS